jgi:hypothetical protein
LDIGVPVGTEFYFTTGGTVIHAGAGTDGWGISVKVRDSNGVIHNYGHLSQAGVHVGDTVSAGQPGGLTGNSGASTGPHLSYDTYDGSGRSVDPSPYLGFNAVGDNRYPQGTLLGQDISNVGEMGGPVEGSEYWEKRRRYNQLYSQFGPWFDGDGDLAKELGIPKPTPEQVREWLQLDGELADYEDQYAAGGTSMSDISSAYDLYNSTDPATVAAKNAAAKYEREYTLRADAATDAGNALQEQLRYVTEAREGQQAMIDSAANGAPRLSGALANPARVKSGQELFQEAFNRLSENLPVVPDLPTPLRPAGSPEDWVARGTSGGRPPETPLNWWEVPAGTNPPKPKVLDQPGLSTQTGGARTGSRALFDEGLGVEKSTISIAANPNTGTGSTPFSEGGTSGLRGSIFDRLNRGLRYRRTGNA